MCGEQHDTGFFLMVIRGSPPRVRGTDIYCVRRCCANGITPACAGNRYFLAVNPLPGEDHPRVCGEQQNPGRLGAFQRGSPPRVRGTGGIFRVQRHDARITPACAGNSPGIASLHSPSRDHPRVCGEQVTDTLDGIEGEGSPPRVRGTAFPLPSTSFTAGITPACAGNSA